jgi:hypothetical protein
MAHKTLPQLINDVGKHLRRSDGTTYTSTTQDADAIMLVSLINVAKDMVEGERFWNALQVDITFDSVISTQEYDLSDLAVVTSDPIVADERTVVLTDMVGRLQMWDVTAGDEFRMHRHTRSWVDDQSRRFGTVTTAAQQSRVAIYPNHEGLTVKFPYPPSDVRSYVLRVYQPQAELANVATEITAPWRPVVLAATALLAEERGEELGLNASTWWERYTDALSQAIIVDMFQDEDAVLVAT